MIEATYIDHMGSDLSVVNAARVSFGKKSHCEEKRWVEMADWCGDMPVVNERDTRLIHYLAKHKHLSPLVMPLHPSMSRHLSLWHVS